MVPLSGSSNSTTSCPVRYTGRAVVTTPAQQDRELSFVESLCACTGAWIAHLTVFSLLTNGPFFSSDGRVCTGIIFGSGRTATQRDDHVPTEG